MGKPPSERSGYPGRIPRLPPASAACASDGMEGARELARSYLIDAVRLLAAIALAPESEAALHTRMMAAKELVSIAGVIPQATPAAPALAPAPLLHEGAEGRREPDA
jgi:hypothetical protein